MTGCVNRVGGGCDGKIRGAVGGQCRPVMRVLGVVVVGVFGGIFLMLLPDLLLATPLEIQNVLRHPLLWIGLAIVPLCLGAEPLAAIPLMRWAARVVGWAKGWGRRVSGTGPAVAAIAAVRSTRMGACAGASTFSPSDSSGRCRRPLARCVSVFLLMWAPHYLTWPAWADTDQFMVSAQSWDAGLRPYRDLPDFDFPGPILLLYVLGKAFGWGRTLPFYAVDLALLFVLGGALVAWSRRMFGAAMPGLIGYLPFLGYYLGLDYSQVAQRDWQGSGAGGARAAGAGGATGAGGAVPLGGRVRGRAGRFALRSCSSAPRSSRRSTSQPGGPGEPLARSLRAMAGWSAALAVSLRGRVLPPDRGGRPRRLRAGAERRAVRRLVQPDQLGQFRNRSSSFRSSRTRRRIGGPGR